MSAETDKDLLQLKKRFLELAEKSYAQNIYTFTGFLSMAEQEALFEAMQKNKSYTFSLPAEGKAVKDRWQDSALWKNWDMRSLFLLRSLKSVLCWRNSRIISPTEISWGR